MRLEYQIEKQWAGSGRISSVKLQNSLFNKLLALAFFLIPFNGILTSKAFGEFQGETAFFLFLPLVFISLPGTNVRESLLRYLILLLGTAIVLSVVGNIPEILSASLRNRSGVNKLVTSAIVVGFMLCFALMIERRLRVPGTLVKQIFKPVVLVTCFLLFMCLFQIASWHSGGAYSAYSAVLSILRPRYDEQAEPGRLDTVSFEPSIFSLFMSFSMVLMLGLSHYLTPGQRRAVHWVLLPGVMSVILFGGARTGLVAFSAIVGFHIIFNVMLRWKRPALMLAISPIILFLIIHILVFVYDKTLLSMILGTMEISNISRYAAIIASFEIYQSFPVFGAGLGQYAFNAETFMPYWGWWSPEVTIQFMDPYPSWPPNHSLPMRLASELGTFGLVAYYGTLCVYFRALAKKIWQERERTGMYPYVGHTLLLGQVFILFSGIAFDSFRQFTVWTLIAATAAYIRYNKPETLFSGVGSLDDDKPPEGDVKPAA